MSSLDCSSVQDSVGMEIKRMTMSKQRYRWARPWCGAVVLAVWVLLVGGRPGEAASRHCRIAVLLPRLTFIAVLEGLREGLAQLGYQEGKNLTFLVEDAQGEAASLTNRAARLVEAKPDIIFTITTASTVAAKQATTTIPIVFTSVA